MANEADASEQVTIVGVRFQDGGKIYSFSPGDTDDLVPGDFVVCDQFVDRTSARKDTFYDGPITTHVSMADPYCPVLRKIAVESARDMGIVVHETGTVVVIQGPRFSTKAESKWFSQMGWEVINMTQYPEAYLARELGMSYAMIALITDYDVGLEGHPEVKPVTHEDVVKVFLANNDKLKKLLHKISRRSRRRHQRCVARY